MGGVRKKIQATSRLLCSLRTSELRAMNLFLSSTKVFMPTQVSEEKVDEWKNRMEQQR